jgi:cell division protein FtsL
MNIASFSKRKVIKTHYKMNQTKRKAKRIADRQVKGVSEEEQPLLTLIAGIIAEIAIRIMNEDEELTKSDNLSNRSRISPPKPKRKKFP